MNKQTKHKCAQKIAFRIDSNLFDSLMTETTNEVSKVKRFNEDEKSFYIENVKFNIFSHLAMKSEFINNQRKVELSDFNKQLYFLILLYCDFDQNIIDYANNKNDDRYIIEKLSFDILNRVLLSNNKYKNEIDLILSYDQKCQEKK